MSLRLLIDEDSQAKLLIILLKKATHDVITVNETNLSGQPDGIVFGYGQRENRIILTRNYDDFQALHLANSNHSGILVICENNDCLKNLSYAGIVKAIANLETANILLVNQFIALNHWNF
ncbi:DUF5615 family PIN-like protein [Gloeocapsa sp. PCC 73106]|uniref:DUF5615 family PIN-like protein n=1 Tax=Gloeocapsa sp. PCC 73106 TaxID=102232 RepID=UPI0002ACF6E3|nr:DUF5615 family PIN-like protein [Gloeocapsa sp. PCC 73106]ELR97820.1 hypothetical protein GLO73106DRAFT_00016370 [Gloeocapsa sp. PCC 73106]